jgi:DNA-binding transcriptional ArsR family regulator
LTLPDPTGVSPYSLDEVWHITRRLSPREDVRAAARAATGEVLNAYDKLWPLDEAPPSTTWAMFLADDDLRFRYLCFDFDASAGDPQNDADRMTYWLEQLNIPHLVCLSGPTGGRHIWVHLAEPADADTVRTIAYLTRSLFPSLDLAPLTNPKAGCVRPPYAPHRAGGHSAPIGDIAAITDHEADEDALEQLRTLLVDLGAELPAPDTEDLHNIVRDADGHPRVRGRRRPMSMAMDSVLHSEAGPDASHTLVRILAAAAHARWGYQDIREQVHSALGLEHARTRRVGATRQRRTEHQIDKVLTAAWEYAVRYVASNPLSATGDDEDYRERTASVTAAVQRALRQADALPGLWSTHNSRVAGTHAQRVVLDAVCLYMLQSSQHTVEADVRRLSADTGYGRTTISQALRALTDVEIAGGWLDVVSEAEGVHARRYRLASRFSTEEVTEERTQAHMRAMANVLPLSQALIREISTRLELFAHDIFCAPHSLGRNSGIVYTHTAEDGVSTLADLANATGLAAAVVRRHLDDLAAAGLVERTEGGWRRYSPTVRDFAARGRGVDGYLEERRARYDEERLVWAWWLAEVTWMERKAKHRRGRKSYSNESDRPDYVAYPRGPTKRRDHKRARELVRAGYLEQGLTLAA